MPRFSERHGYTRGPSAIQYETMSDGLRNSLWSVLDSHLFSNKAYARRTEIRPPVWDLARRFWFEVYKRPVDEIPERGHQIVSAIRREFFESPWYEVYDLIEVTVDQHPEREKLMTDLNAVLERELAGYRLISGKIVPITDAGEIEALQEALSDDQFASVSEHIGRALELLSDRNSPDYRNSIKESISAVEAMARIITGEEKATLGEALAVLERNHKLHSALKKGFSNLYGYTSDEGGVRHAMIEESYLSAADAKYFLLSCTSFVNYLKSKM